jgi:DNA-binding LacI/PurR family transcriptional regulator
MVAITQKELARQLGVSRSLVSMALSDAPAVNAQTKRRIRRAAADLGYVRDLGAATLAGGRARVVGLLLSNLRNPFFEGVADAVQRHAEALDLTAFIATGGNDEERERQVVDRFRALRPAGLIIVSPSSTPQTLQAVARQVPLVVIGQQKTRGLVDLVHIDEAAAATLIAARARQWGARRLALLTEAAAGTDDTIPFRQAAIAAAAAAAGLDFADLATIEAAVALAAASRHGELTISAHNDATAAPLVTALRSAGLIPGGDVAVIGFDDTHVAAQPEFSLTSVRQDPDALAAAALDLVTTRLDNPNRRGRVSVIAPTLTLRASG